MLRWLLEWMLVLDFVGQAQRPDDCWLILDHDLADWPEGMRAARLCTNRFPAHYEQPARHDCEVWNRGLEDRVERLRMAALFDHTELEMLQLLVGWWEKDECHRTRRDELLFFAARQKAEREAEWACEWDVWDRNEKRARRGREEIDSESCWIHAGGTRWRKFYEGP